ncbi:MAG: hypothetical protein SCARUB_00216 [Candidatus Scalindua rubra]|uniref:DUF2442 domain-containing protein n=1 Tax=Candidatus Scalindua rubra TaxID=1872076 RepID=A0A1E3XG70_9BACT|nr:MAG: hypothetical protein SCARUB_00216 [Candidatus Scalindua rubra]
MEKVIKVRPKTNYVIEVTFEDGFKGKLNMRPLIRDGITKDLKDFGYFKKVEIDGFGGIYWPNGYDICPNYLREIMEKENKRIVKRKRVTFASKAHK